MPGEASGGPCSNTYSRVSDGEGGEEGVRWCRWADGGGCIMHRGEEMEVWRGDGKEGGNGSGSGGGVMQETEKREHSAN